MPIVKFTLELQWAEMISPNTRHLAFKRQDGEVLDFIPGQFITIYFEKDSKTLRRSYSLATVPGKSDLVEFAASYFQGGPGTELLFGLEPGDCIEAGGAFGRLVLKDEQPKRYILVATGTGVTPYRSMLPALSKRLQDSDLEVVILLGVRDRQHALYAEEFKVFADEHPNATFQACYSRQMPDDTQPHEGKGYAQNFLAPLNPNPENDIVYLCGNPGMIDASFELLKEKGFDSHSVRREKYISSK